MLDVKRWMMTIASAAALAVSGCSGNPFSSSPFGSASSVDVQFVNASQTWDLDKNGTVTCDEWKQYAGGEHRQADGDGDGALSSAEWPKLVQSDRLFETTGLGYFDGNGDGKVTAEEMASKQNPAFKMLDRNGDCQLGHDEKATVYSNARPKSKADNNAQPPGPPPPGGR